MQIIPAVFSLCAIVISETPGGSKYHICSIHGTTEQNKYLFKKKSRADERPDVPLEPDQESSLRRDNLDVVVEAQPSRARYATMHVAQHNHPRHSGRHRDFQFR